tara:strand:- start:870 stop:1220 length:351 start_codon:yes stop_codon:yes gene_type:complete
MKISEEEINIIISQTNSTREKVKKYLYHNKGDIVKTIIDIENNISIKEEEDIKDDEYDKIDLKDQKKIESYRKIVDEKDELYYKNKNQVVKNDFCVEKKYFIKRQKEGDLNKIVVL